MNWKPKDLKRQQQHIIPVFTPFWQIRYTLRDPTKPQKRNSIVHSKQASQVSVVPISCVVANHWPPCALPSFVCSSQRNVSTKHNPVVRINHLLKLEDPQHKESESRLMIVSTNDLESENSQCQATFLRSAACYSCMKNSQMVVTRE